MYLEKYFCWPLKTLTNLIFVCGLLECKCLENSIYYSYDEIDEKTALTIPTDILTDSMITAIKNDFLKGILKSLKEGNFKEDNTTGYKLIKLAIQEPQNNIPILQYLLTHGSININTTNTWGTTILAEAVQTNLYKPEIVKFLLQQGAIVNQLTDKWHNTPIFYAICSNNLTGLKLLVEAGGDINAVCDQYGNRPLHLAADKNNLDIVIYLLQKGADKYLLNSNGEFPYQYTVSIEIKNLLT